MDRPRGAKGTAGGKRPPARTDSPARGTRKPPTRPAARASDERRDAGRASAERGGEGGIETVREILFGPSLRALTAELARLEERTLRALDELREDMRRHDRAVEEFAKRELGSLSKRLTTEASERAEGAQGLLDQLKKAVAALEKRDAQIDESLAAATRDLREQLLAQTGDLLERQRRWREEILGVLSEGLEGLRATETDRATLASLLSEMSARIASSAPSSPPTMH